MDKAYRRDPSKPLAGEWRLATELGGPGGTIVAAESDDSEMYGYPGSREFYKGAVVAESINGPDARLIIEMHELLRTLGALRAQGPGNLDWTKTTRATTLVLELADRIAKLDVEMKA